MEKIEVVVFEDSLPSFKKSYLKLRLVLLVFLLVLISDHNVRVLFAKSDPRLVACMLILFVYALYALFRQFRAVCLDTSVVEDLECDSDRLDPKKRVMPLDKKQLNSFFVKKYVWLSYICTGQVISSFREKSLRSEYLRENKELNLIGGVLTLLGLAGTMMGLANALAGISQGIDITAGVSYAFGSTLMGVFGYIVISTINLMLQNKKTELFYSFLDILSRNINKNKNEESSHADG